MLVALLLASTVTELCCIFFTIMSVNCLNLQSIWCFEQWEVVSVCVFVKGVFIITIIVFIGVCPGFCSSVDGCCGSARAHAANVSSCGSNHG